MDKDSIIKDVTSKTNGTINYIMSKIAYIWDKDATKFYIAGGCLASRSICDIDIFPIGNTKVAYPKKAELIVRTKNASTFKTDMWPIQICNYRHETLKELVDSFDYAHIQIGAMVSLDTNGWHCIEEVYFTDDFIKAKVTDTTWFCGSKYPLSSLVRAAKYKEKKVFPRTGAYVAAVLGVMVAVIKRGFSDYEDFKDQLDAVDLGMVPDEFKDLEFLELKELYNLLAENKE